MSPAKLSLSMVASPQSPLLFPLAKSLYLQSRPAQTARAVPAADEVAAVGEPLPTYDRAPHESPPVVPPAYPAASHNRSRCADAPCCNDPRSFESSVAQSSTLSGVSGRMHSL